MDAAPQSSSAHKWQPVGAVARRVLGVLVEKAKTTPDVYPLSLAGLTTGCNQKNNRDPQTNYSPDQVQEALDKLRELGAAAEVQGSGRVAKYRHLLYDWLGADKAELAVMADLLLRGAQTVGELRAHAARMEPIADLTALRPILQTLITKGLVISLTPEGRGQVVTHALFKDHELAEQRAQVAGGHFSTAAGGDDDSPSPAARPSPTPSAHGAAEARTPSGITADMFHELELEVASLRADVARLREEMRRLREGAAAEPVAGSEME